MSIVKLRAFGFVLSLLSSALELAHELTAFLLFDVNVSLDLIYYLASSEYLLFVQEFFNESTDTRTYFLISNVLANRFCLLRILDGRIYLYFRNFSIIFIVDKLSHEAIRFLVFRGIIHILMT